MITLEDADRLADTLFEQWRTGEPHRTRRELTVALILDVQRRTAERAAAIADEISDGYHKQWRAGYKCDGHLEGKSDGAEDVAIAIRERLGGPVRIPGRREGDYAE